ncbi:xanthine dehydrogenase accessory protein XdhC [Sulfitobacter sp. EhC04]|uniref:xanthine dehydrogenase accessory protein XdhC n=1 Tax=Sulfitobacter sp. EhC04 TaxID=1849168 RepID=UPI0007F3A28C|nr:xanthine dehydrogenase accessory protein XdhC [Sulfitobacter sp. EhC04]OAN76920.1 xanthine dehydrogenase accessory protein XdhC [Sulfitobacter sp. EhC04]
MRLSQFLGTNSDIVRVSLCRVRGSSPREAGAEMFVTPNGLHGTIGGGQLEYMAIDQARKMLCNGRNFDQMDVPLGPEIGQCCGGRVDLDLRRMSQTDRAEALAADVERHAARSHVYILGAGHIGRALARFFQFLPIRCILIDSRAEELALADAEVEKRLSPMAEADIRAAPPGSAFIVLTHDHALDFLLTSEALDRRDAAYVGLIGSATKRMKFARFHQSHAAQSDCTRLICPIGDTSSPDKRPEVIATSVTAQVMSVLTSARSEDVKLTN